MKLIKPFLLLALLWTSYVGEGHAQRLAVKLGKIHFVSEAPLELIEAASEELKGLIDTQEHTFAFSVNMQSFEGFNSPLQKEHFHENYLESAEYPKATFSGKIIEKLDFSKTAQHAIRVKGIFTIHGVEQERIIRALVDVQEKTVVIHAEFVVPLESHDISIPRLMSQKISEEIRVNVDAELSPK